MNKYTMAMNKGYTLARVHCSQRLIEDELETSVVAQIIDFLPKTGRFVDYQACSELCLLHHSDGRKEGRKNSLGERAHLGSSCYSLEDMLQSLHCWLEWEFCSMRSFRDAAPLHTVVLCLSSHCIHLQDQSLTTATSVTQAVGRKKRIHGVQLQSSLAQTQQ